MFALISTVCTNPIDSYHLLYHRFGKKSMYKLHKISQRFLCRIPIDSKQGAPGPPARLCAMVHVYPYPGTPTLVPLPLYPWYPIPTTYIHTCIDTFVLFIYLSYCLCLSYSSLLSCSLSSRSLLVLGKACPWAEAAGLIFLVCANVLFYLIIIQQYTCMVGVHVSTCTV